jgi:hypothetical protein
LALLGVIWLWSSLRVVGTGDVKPAQSVAERCTAEAKAQQQFALSRYERAIRTSFREVSDALVEHRKAKEIRAQPW